MRLTNACIISAVLAGSIMYMSGCMTPREAMSRVVGNSTKAIEDARPSALVKTFDYDYKTCYEKTEKLLKAMPKTSIYAKDAHMIAVYYIDPNTTPVGIYFKEIDPSHTQVEVSSQGEDAKKWIADNIYSETIKPATPDVTTVRTEEKW